MWLHTPEDFTIYGPSEQQFSGQGPPAPEWLAACQNDRRSTKSDSGAEPQSLFFLNNHRRDSYAKDFYNKSSQNFALRT